MSRLHIPKQNLPRVKNRITTLYVEHAKLSVKNNNILVCNKDGEYPIPVATIAVLLLGPGTSITHDASLVLAESGTLCSWCDSFGSNIHSFMFPASKIWHSTSDNIERQAEIASISKLRTLAVRKMFALRYGDEYDQSKTRSISHMMGIEGRHVRKTYEKASKKFGIEWNGRVSKVSDMCRDDIPNFVLTMSMQELYSIVTAVCYSLGCSPALGFLHRGNSRSFIFDVADLWKESIIIPMSFSIASNWDGYCDISYYDTKKEIRERIKDAMSAYDFASMSVDAIEKMLWGLDG